MGCGESKHDVATGNTITRKKSDAGNRKSKDLEIIQENSNNDNKENSSVRDSVKDITENKEFQEDGGVESGRLISKDSPHRFFSSRKDDDVEGEGRSDKSETFYSPRVESGKETLFNVENGKMNGDKMVQEASQETGQKDETAIVREEDLAKEAQISASTVKPDALEKKQNGEEVVTVPVTKDQKFT